MERRLIVMRHAKSSWADGDLSDHARPLNGRGRKSAPRVAQRLIELDWLPEHVASSDATRTRQTWMGMAPVFSAAAHGPPVLTLHSELYLAGFKAVRAAAASWDPALRTVMVLGHNPGWEELVSLLSDVHVRMTTGNAALLVSQAPAWQQALDGTWRLDQIIRPREL